MNATKTRCGKVQLILTEKEAQLLKHLTYSHIAGSPTQIPIDNPVFAFIKFVEVKDTPANRKESAHSRNLFDDIGSALSYAGISANAPVFD